jgi:hypothetical protein
MKKVHYIDSDTRIRYRYASSLLGWGHVLERRKRWWVFAWWVERVSMYDEIISAEKDFDYLVHWLLWREEQVYPVNTFKGYPSTNA